ncbi:hypothetical protein A2851_05545 [Candidatus Kaiserbacteria bacterium RIFCSPHIGHO2_01_FULL_53_29]|uniref:Uncharacterized protein n=1 Tax=Candidatus Kaiserbacteria bacterium RIFCSPHIGHO2_01_FULL_53_29 TaxID=1798480 RepID=A0A1F6CTX3_9BACT|nr:MAG: hypothetical protein A2851_05545 [Candidatus Kaiserbacteria bacterium RIFCSPHIGHO2_01_FULL_53_29]
MVRHVSLLCLSAHFDKLSASRKNALKEGPDFAKQSFVGRRAMQMASRSKTGKPLKKGGDLAGSHREHFSLMRQMETNAHQGQQVPVTIPLKNKTSGDLPRPQSQAGGGSTHRHVRIHNHRPFHTRG